MENQTPKAFTANLSVSNTDIVTMMVVKQKEILEDRINELILEQEKLVNSYVTVLEKLVNEKLAKNKKEIETIKKAWTALYKMYNPKIKFELKQTDEQSIWISNKVRNTFKYQGNNFIANPSKLIKIEIRDMPNLVVVLEDFDNDEGNFDYLGKEDDCITYPFNLNISLNISQEDLVEYTKMQKELNDISNLKRNEANLRDKIVAQMTESVLSNIPELQEIVNNVKLIS